MKSLERTYSAKLFLQVGKITAPGRTCSAKTLIQVGKITAPGRTYSVKTSQQVGNRSTIELILLMIHERYSHLFG